MHDSEYEKASKKAKNVVFRLFKYRIRSTHEIRKKLYDKGFEEDIIFDIIKYFSDLTLLDDRNFANKWIASRLARPLGANRIRLELIKKGIDKEIINNELKKAVDPEIYKELTIIKELAQKRASKYRDVEKNKIKQRLYGYLLRRGFNSHSVIKTIKEL